MAARTSGLALHGSRQHIALAPHRLDDGRLTRILAKRLAAFPHARLLYRHTVTGVVQDEAGARVLLAGGETLAIVDVGLMPPPTLSTGTHAGSLSFELSAGDERIIVNCGSSYTKGAEWTQAMRATAAHSTVTVADTSSAHIMSGKS